MMKYMLIFFLSLSGLMMLQSQPKASFENILITSNKGKVRVSTNENGELQVNVSPEDILKFKAIGSVRYSDFGAKGNGKTDDINAIAGTHEFANQHDLMVKADEEAEYYIGGKERTAIIQTNTDFGTAKFIIDGTEVQDRNASIFMVNSNLRPFKTESITKPKRNQEKVDLKLEGSCLIEVRQP